jgi:flavin reductase (DIM6/NTAB) family NADH-FMN oxidoreductase RutF
MAVSSQEFKNALKLWASGVTVITAGESDDIKGMTATSFSSVSLDPPQILVCINKNADTGEVLLNHQQFVVNVLKAGQEQISNEFAGSTTQQERFANVSWHKGQNGCPVLDDALVSIECKLVEQVSAGSHWVVIGEVQKADCRSGDPLLYFNSGYYGLTTTD